MPQELNYAAARSSHGRRSRKRDAGVVVVRATRAAHRRTDLPPPGHGPSPSPRPTTSDRARVVPRASAVDLAPKPCEFLLEESTDGRGGQVCAQKPIAQSLELSGPPPTTAVDPSKLHEMRPRELSELLGADASDSRLDELGDLHGRGRQVLVAHVHGAIPRGRQHRPGCPPGFQYVPVYYWTGTLQPGLDGAQWSTGVVRRQ